MGKFTLVSCVLNYCTGSQKLRNAFSSWQNCKPGCAERL